jgi:hypothetical protein
VHKTITKNMFDVVTGVTIIAAVFYLAAITHMLPLPESALTRLSGFSSNVMDVLFACGSWVIRLFVDWKHFNHVRRDCSRLVAINLRKKLLGSPYRSRRSPHWLKVKNPKAPTVKREAEEDSGRWKRKAAIWAAF